MKLKDALTKYIYQICFYTFLMLFGINTITKAGPVDEKNAKAVALTQLKKVGKGISTRSSASLEIVDKAMLNNGKVAYYIINSSDGFIIVSGDDRVMPVLAYSTTGSAFDLENIPPAMEILLNGYKEEINDVISADLKISDDIVKEKWNELKNGIIQSDEIEIRNAINTRNGELNYDPSPYQVGTFLIKTRWNQSGGYNAMCPVISGNYRYSTGCVATAMAQIIRYWECCSRRGFGSHYYTPKDREEIGVLFADFENTIYEYEKMPSVAISQEAIDAVSLLMYHVGISVDMNYGKNGTSSSSAKTYAIDASEGNSYDAFRNYWGYKDVKCARKEYYTYAEWLAIIKSQIDKKYPILYDATDHAFVCDGYDNENRVHINWGWGGDQDGFFLLSAMLANGKNYGSMTYEMIVDIYPTELDFVMPERYTEEPGRVEGTTYREDYMREILSESNTNPSDSGYIDNLFWSLNDSILTISGIGAMRNFPETGTSPWFFYGSFIKKVIINNGVTTIGDRAFCSSSNIVSFGNGTDYTYRNLQSIEISNSVTSIGELSFENCALQNIKMPDSLISIGLRAFRNCYNLTGIEIPDGVTSIGALAFYACNNLTSIKIPNSVTYIGESAFPYYFSGSVIQVDVYWENPLSYNNTFGNITTSTLVVPAGTKALYEVAPVWKDFGTIIEREVIVPVTSISLTLNSATIIAGSYLQNIATVSPENATDKSIKWASNNEVVATVDSLGKVTAIAQGSTIITATTNDGNKSATLNVTVTEVEVLTISLEKSSSVLIGDTMRFTPTINPSYASNKTVTWSSSNESIAIVDATGKVTGISKGTAIIKVTTNNGKKANCVVLVTESPLINYAAVVIPITNLDEFIIFNIERLAGSDEANLFAMGFPEGLEVYPEEIIFAESLSEGLEFETILLGNNVWLFEISAHPIAPSSYLLRSGKNKQFTNIICELTGRMSDIYEVQRGEDINDVTIPKFELALKVGETANSEYKKDINVLLENGILSIETPDAETIKVFNISGSLVYIVIKDKGKASYPVYNMPNGIYIVTGSKGWSTKVLKK